MNYIRNAFSSASQYYTSLPPINPSTLTGAIDVIVIERESEEHPGETELACSPFHVRFGKWQAFRPSDKQVRSSVRNQPFLALHMVFSVFGGRAVSGGTLGNLNSIQSI